MRSLCAAAVPAAFLLLGGCATAGLEPDSYDAMRAQTVKLEMQDGNGHGSGVIVSPGYILTAAHVVDDGGPGMRVKFTDGTTGYAALSWEDQGRDVAIMRLDAPTKLPPATLSQEPLHIGEVVYAAGYPLELPLSVVRGEVASASTADAEIPAQYKADAKGFASLIVLNCDIVPGDSGGPVFNASGEVVGINDAQFPGPKGADSGLTAMVGMQFIIGDVHTQIAGL